MNNVITEKLDVYVEAKKNLWAKEDQYRSLAKRAAGFNQPGHEAQALVSLDDLLGEVLTADDIAFEARCAYEIACREAQYDGRVRLRDAVRAELPS